ncbi:MAG: hypothetical protein WC678_01520 [Parcubacteria group bacterium]|jgi:hypothetical protein
MYEQQISNTEQIKTEPEKYRDEILGLKNKLDKITTDLADIDQTFEIMERVAAFSESIKEKFPDYASYGAWHGFSGSDISNNEAPVTKLDFNGEYNVKNFLEKLLAELENTEK